MKNIVQLGMIVLLLVCCCLYSKNMVPVYAEETLQTEDGIYYEVTEQNTIRITGAKASLSELSLIHI